MTTYDQFIQEGFYIDVPKRFTARFSKNKTRRFQFEVPAMAVGVKLADLYAKIELPEDISDIRRETKRQAFLCCRVVAVAYLAGYSGIPGLARVFAWYLYHRIDASKLNQLQKMIHALTNYPAFLNAVRFMSAAPRTTAPA